MAFIPPNTDFTDKDFDALRARMINLVRSVFPTWTDFNVENFGVILLELFAHVGDVLLFYQDNQARESRISTARLRKSLIGLSKLIGYEPPGATAATVDVTVTLGASPAGSVTFSAGDTFRTLEVTEPVVFQLLADVVIAAGASPPTAILQLENSANSQESSTSTLLAGQSRQLSDTPYLDGSLSVTAADGTYTEVDNFLSSSSSDRHFTVVVDENDRATVTFGDGVNGAVPQGVITYDYKTGGGVVGNVVAGSVTRTDKSYSDSLGNAVTLTLTHAAAASGGSDRQSVEAIRSAAPESIRAVNRTVAREDFEINAKKVAGVERALMLTSNERPEIAENSGILHVIPSGGGLPSSSLKSSVATKLTVDLPHHLTFSLTVSDPEYETVDVDATLFLSDGASPSVVGDAVRSALTSFFALTNSDGSENDNVDFGFNMKKSDGTPANEVAWSDVFNVVRDVAGVRKIGDALGSFLLNGSQSDVAIATQKFPVLGTVTLVDGQTGATL